MSNVWFAIPSARPDGGTARLWRDKGYNVALWIDQGAPEPSCANMVVRSQGAYPGYGAAMNALVKEVLSRDPRCDWVVTGGDDIDPDPNGYPEAIARSCSIYFGLSKMILFGETEIPMTFGVMQPTGDRWGDQNGVYIDRICGSPWLGRQFCERMYGGTGPYWPGYRHMFVDEELFNVATKLGCLWQRPDLTHMHHHIHRDGRGVVPEFLQYAYGAQHWGEASTLFESRRRAGFPGYEPRLG